MSEQQGEREYEMSQEDPTMPEIREPSRSPGSADSQPAAPAEAVTEPPSQSPPPEEALAEEDGYGGVEEPLARGEEWLDEAPELPRRPRSRLLAPVPLALLGVLLLACGFIGGVLIEKGQSSSASASGSSGAGLAARFAALRSGAGSAGPSTGDAAGAASPGGASAGGSGFPGGFARPTSGTVAYVSGSTLYVTEAEGNTVKVTTSPATTVSKQVKGHVDGIHPGETVAISGSTASNGSVSAETIRVGSEGGGIAALFGAGGAGGGGSGGGGSGGGSGGNSAGGSSSSEPALFGSGGK